MTANHPDMLRSTPGAVLPLGAHLARLRALVIGSMGFLTLVDLFATQAILPSLAKAYGVSPAAIGVAVNACTIGMALSCLGVGLISRRIDPRTGIWVSLTLLAIPTSLLAVAPNLLVFTALRIAQGVFMASAFTLTMAYLADRGGAKETATALAAYITGVVASNLVGRLLAGSVADMYGLPANFFVFAALNLVGAGLVIVHLERMTMIALPAVGGSVLAAWALHLRNGALRSAFAIGFMILFAFIGTFTYVNFVLSGPVIGLDQMTLGFVYLVFLPSMITTPIAGQVAVRFGARWTTWGALAVGALGLPLLLVSNLWVVLAGMTLVGIGTFFAQAVVTGFVGRAATAERAAASGLYLASYYSGGLAGAAVLGQVFDNFGWTLCVVGIAASLFLAGCLASNLRS
jgi:MFS transporter, YNFM family, putative membrane transport protein